MQCQDAMEGRAQPGHQQRMILVVDDSPDARELWRVWLTYRGFDVIEARNGAEAVEQVTRHVPDLVLMDLTMPVMNGLEALRVLRARQGASALPIIIVSGEGADAAQRARELGSDAFMMKPVAPEVLLEHIHLLLGHH